MISKIDRSNLEFYFTDGDGGKARQSLSNLSHTITNQQLKTLKDALSLVTEAPVESLMVVTRTQFE